MKNLILITEHHFPDSQVNEIYKKIKETINDFGEGLFEWNSSGLVLAMEVTNSPTLQKEQFHTILDDLPGEQQLVIELDKQIKFENRRPQLFKLAFLTGLVEPVYRNKTYCDLLTIERKKLVTNKVFHETLKSLGKAEDSGTILCTPGFNPEWLGKFTNKTGYLVGMFRAFVGNYDVKASYVMAVTVPNNPKLVDPKNKIEVFKTMVHNAMTLEQPLAKTAWAGVLEPFHAMGKVMRNREPDELEFVIPEWKPGQQQALPDNSFLILVLINYRPEIYEGNVPRDIHETLAYLQHKNTTK